MGRYSKAAKEGFNQGRKNPSLVAQIFWTFVFGGLFITLGWNYGATEIIESLGGTDSNLDVLEGLAVWVFLAVASKAVRGYEIT